MIFSRELLSIELMVSDYSEKFRIKWLPCRSRQQKDTQVKSTFFYPLVLNKRKYERITSRVGDILEDADQTSYNNLKNVLT